MKKINNYRVIQNDNGTWGVIGITGVKEEFLFNIDDIGENVTNNELIERVMVEFKTREIEIVDLEATEFMEEQKIDLSLVRTKMREIMKQLSNKDIPIRERKELLDLYQQINSSAQIICNVCKIELQIDQVSNNKRKR